MIDTKEFSEALSKEIPRGVKFIPIHVPTTEYSPQSDAEGDSNDNGEVKSPVGLQRQEIAPQKITRQIVAIDSTRLLLGEIPDGIVGCVRASIVTDATTSERRVEHHGAYVFPVTNQSSQAFYSRVYSAVYGEQPSATPILAQMLDRVGNLLERHVQFEVVKSARDSLILFDGSLIAGTVGNPRFFLERILQAAEANNNQIVAISKKTELTLAGSQSSILSVASDGKGPCYFGDLRRYVTQDPSRYLGEIYVARLSPSGRSFRVDIPKGPLSSHETLCTISSYVGEDGYSEDLRLAHMTCVFSSIEAIELQAAAIAAYRMSLADDIRGTLFPFP
jgi:hypothetical protein